MPRLCCHSCTISTVSSPFYVSIPLPSSFWSLRKGRGAAPLGTARMLIKHIAKKNTLYNKQSDEKKQMHTPFNFVLPPPPTLGCIIRIIRIINYTNYTVFGQVYGIWYFAHMSGDAPPTYRTESSEWVFAAVLFCGGGYTEKWTKFRVTVSKTLRRFVCT